LNAKGIPAEDIAGSKGQFDVLRDGTLVFSKQQAGRFPEHDEILEAVQR
jgi:selT/selW/selH-like putative selenoprotein